MGTNGDNFIDYSYPPLDSYRTSEGKGFIHNTPGVEVAKLPRGAKLVEPDPERAWREEKAARQAPEATPDHDAPQYSQPPSNLGDPSDQYYAGFDRDDERARWRRGRTV